MHHTKGTTKNVELFIGTTKREASSPATKYLYDEISPTSAAITKSNTTSTTATTPKARSPKACITDRYEKTYFEEGREIAAILRQGQPLSNHAISKQPQSATKATHAIRPTL